MVEIVSRRAWGSSPLVSPTSRNIAPGRGGVALHWTGGTTGVIPSCGCDRAVRSVQRFHTLPPNKGGRGWSDIAYTLLVCQHGTVYEGRGVGHRTAANGTNRANDQWYAVCALQGAGDKPTDELLAGLRGAVEYLWDHGARRATSGHRDHYDTDCPGPALHAWQQAGMPTDGDLPLTPPAPPKGRPMRLLRLGSAGTDVRIWQARLLRLGYGPLHVDGQFGPLTQAATIRFQQRHKLSPDGVVGPRTVGRAW